MRVPAFLQARKNNASDETATNAQSRWKAELVAGCSLLMVTDKLQNYS
jgi:hypothetical protein